jgi:hypothetical protein
MPSRTSLVRKAAAGVLHPGEELETACMVSLPGTMKREGRQAMLRGALNVHVIDLDDDAFPEKMLAAATTHRVLLFEQSMFGRAKKLVADIPFDQIAGIGATGTSRAQVSLRILEFAIAAERCPGGAGIRRPQGCRAAHRRRPLPRRRLTTGGEQWPRDTSS